MSPYAAPPGPAPDGANGLAIAALVCGLAFFVPGAGLVALVLGIIALRQLRARAQRGRGMAITGIVVGSLTTISWGLILAALLAFVGSERVEDGVAAPSAAHPTTGRVTIDELRPGDCFSGISPASLDWASLSSCDDEHEMQLITIVDFGDEPFPGSEDAVGALSERRCIAASEPLLDESKLDRVEFFFIYPDSRFAWEVDATALCIASSLDGGVRGSVLK